MIGRFSSTLGSRVLVLALVSLEDSGNGSFLTLVDTVAPHADMI